ncbi:MAG: hypothetical protein KKA42_00525 [candidate division Zixibacteria bacterium]|nr:hypothetical protein [candidate division Zixibacteria bacterium]
MGEQLVKLYSFVASKYGLSAQVKLAQETKIPSTKAALEPDTPDTIELFKKAIEKITGESSTTA